MKSVSIEKCLDYEEENLEAALKKTFDNLGGIGTFIKPGMKVALKPNLILRKNPKDAATTNPAFVKVIAKMMLEKGAHVTLVESPGGFYSESVLKSVYSGCGMTKVSQEIDLKLNYDTEEIEVKNPDTKLLNTITVIKPLIDADIIVNLPKLKAHGQMAYTGAVKNMFGAVPGVKKAEYHMKMADYEDFADAIIDIFLSVKPKLNIMDAIIGMEGEGPTSGDPKQIGLIIASEDAFALDCTALKIIDKNPKQIPILNHAMQRKLCSESFGDIITMGEKPEDVMITDFKMPHIESLKTIQFFNKGPFKYLIKSMKPKPVFYHEFCTGCQSCMNHCPAHAIEFKENRPYVDLSECISCFCCQELCPANAIKIKRSLLSKLVMKNKKKKQ